MPSRLEILLTGAVDRNASDVHLMPGRPPQLRIDGRLVPAENQPLSTAEVEELCHSTLSTEQIERLQADLELDLSFDLPGVCRFRANIYRAVNGFAGAFRPIPYVIPDPKKLGIPPIAFELGKKTRGLILVTGATGSGKSTTMATMIEDINRRTPCHIVTLEDPIEFIFTPSKATFSQREVGHDTHSFQRGLKYILRQDPDVVLIGEMRDLETIQSAITVAETGHLVLATLHTNNATQTIDRIVDVFPPHQQTQIRLQLSFVLEAVISQNLIPGIGSGRRLATEILIPSSGIRNTIREGKTHQIAAQMQTGQRESGMCLMDQSLAQLVRENGISREEALRVCNDLEFFMSLL